MSLTVWDRNTSIMSHAMEVNDKCKGGGHYMITVPLGEARLAANELVLEKAYRVTSCENAHITRYNVTCPGHSLPAHFCRSSVPKLLGAACKFQNGLAARVSLPNTHM